MIKFSALAFALLLVSFVPAPASAAEQAAGEKVILHVDQNDPKVMELALNNVNNLVSYYKQNGQTVQIEVVTYGPGLNMLRQDTSPVKDRIASIALENQNVQFIACGNTLENMTKKEGTKPPLVSEAKLVPAGIVRIIELERQGYVYIKP